MTGVQTCALPICFPVTIGVGNKVVGGGADGVGSDGDGRRARGTRVRSARGVNAAVVRDRNEGSVVIGTLNL